MQLAKFAEKYTKELRRWIEPLFIEKKPEPTTERNCISLGSKELCLVHINKTLDTTELISSDNLHFEDHENLPLLLSSFLERHNLSSIPTYWLLSPEQYQLFIIESLPVASDEFKAAINWRIRSLINYPIEETVIDSFKLPSKKASPENMVAAVVTRRNQLVRLIDIFKKAGLNLTTIDVPELAMRNLIMPYENDEKSTAFIYFYERIAILNITRQKTLYFTRRINLYSETDVSMNQYQQFSLDILRYFD
jgi:MSHA biogenesis protein MshI